MERIRHRPLRGLSTDSIQGLEKGGLVSSVSLFQALSRISRREAPTPNPCSESARAAAGAGGQEEDPLLG